MFFTYIVGFDEKVPEKKEKSNVLVAQPEPKRYGLIETGLL